LHWEVAHPKDKDPSFQRSFTMICKQSQEKGSLRERRIEGENNKGEEKEIIRGVGGVFFLPSRKDRRSVRRHRRKTEGRGRGGSKGKGENAGKRSGGRRNDRRSKETKGGEKKGTFMEQEERGSGEGT